MGGRQLLVVLLSIGLGSLSCKNSSPVVADLIAAENLVARARGDAGSFEPAKVGDTFARHDAVRTGGESSARVRLRGGAELALASHTLLRFGRSGDRLQVATGTAEIEAGAGDIFVETSIGLARIEASSRVRVDSDRGQLRFRVMVGLASIDNDGGETTAAAGSGFTVDIGNATVELEAVVDAGVAPTDAATESDDTNPPSGDSIDVAVTGVGVELRQFGDDRWQTLPAGAATIPAGARLRAPSGTSLTISRPEGQARVAGAAEILVGQTPGRLFEIRSGKVTIESRRGSIVVGAPGGSVGATKQAKGSRAEIEVDGRGEAEVTAARGLVAVKGQSSEVISGGERARLAGDGRLVIFGAQPDYADLMIPAGESATLHDPKPPTAIAIDFAEICDGLGTVEVAKGRSFAAPIARPTGTGSANLLLGRGTYRYRVRCRGQSDPEPTAGTIEVVRDSGRAELARRAPQSYVDADGRRYTLLYQSHLPRVTIRWREAPEASSFTLHLEPSHGKPQSYELKAATETLASGKLREGSYTYWFTTGSQSSPRSTLRISFDNASPTAYVKSPRDGVAWGSQIEVAGATLPNWSVSVAGTTLAVDSQRRFAATVAAPVAERALAIRLAHPARGVHYYLRRGKVGK